MKKYTFPYGGSFGPGDSWDGEVEVELTNRDASRLEESARKEPRWRLDDDPEVYDIYCKVEKKAIRNDILSITSDDSFMEQLRSDYEDRHDDERIPADSTIARKWLEESTLHINYPKELQDLTGDGK